MYPTYVKSDFRLLQSWATLTSLHCFPLPFLTTGTTCGCASSLGTRTQILQQLHGPLTHNRQWHAAEVDMQGAAYRLACAQHVPDHYAETSDSNYLVEPWMSQVQVETEPSQRGKTPVGTSQPTSNLLQAHLLGSLGLENYGMISCFRH